MYNKLFNKIVDSSIWMEADHVRLVWMMFIAIMDEDGFVNLATIKNVAHRAVIDIDKAEDAIGILEAPDAGSSNPENEGRRLQRVPGGWMVINAPEYRDIVKREHQKELNRKRVKRHRERNACNGAVMPSNDLSRDVTPSDTETDTDLEAKSEAKEETKTHAQSEKVGRDALAVNLVFDKWNEKAATEEDLKLVRKLTPDRLSKLRARMKDCDWPWEEAIGMLPLPSGESSKWQPDFDWLILNDRNAYKITEGVYDWRATMKTNGRTEQKPLSDEELFGIKS